MSTSRNTSRAVRAIMRDEGIKWTEAQREHGLRQDRPSASPASDSAREGRRDHRFSFPRIEKRPDASAFEHLLHEPRLSVRRGRRKPMIFTLVLDSRPGATMSITWVSDKTRSRDLAITGGPEPLPPAEREGIARWADQVTRAFDERGLKWAIESNAESVPALKGRWGGMTDFGVFIATGRPGPEPKTTEITVRGPHIPPKPPTVRGYMAHVSGKRMDRGSWLPTPPASTDQWRRALRRDGRWLDAETLEPAPAEIARDLEAQRPRELALAELSNLFEDAYRNHLAGLPMTSATVAMRPECTDWVVDAGPGTSIDLFDGTTYAYRRQSDWPPAFIEAGIAPETKYSHHGYVVAFIPPSKPAPAAMRLRRDARRVRLVAEVAREALWLTFDGERSEYGVISADRGDTFQVTDKCHEDTAEARDCRLTLAAAADAWIDLADLRGRTRIAAHVYLTQEEREGRWPGARQGHPLDQRTEQDEAVNLFLPLPVMAVGASLHVGEERSWVDGGISETGRDQGSIPVYDSRWDRERSEVGRIVFDDGDPLGVRVESHVQLPEIDEPRRVAPAGASVRDMLAEGQGKYATFLFASWIESYLVARSIGLA